MPLALGCGNNGQYLPLRWWYFLLVLVALIYATLAGLRTVTDWDLGWQLATGRWIVQHHQIPSVDVFSYTAGGHPWIYPVGSALIFYALYLVGNYVLLSWLGTAACVGTVALLLRQSSWVTAVLTIVAIPRIALRTTPRAELFSIVLFAAFLSLLWENFETGTARLWLLPLMMVGWVNLHLGLNAGIGLLVGYLLLEAAEMLWPERRLRAIDRLRRALPWFLATVGAVLLNPWGWRGFAKSLSFMAPMASGGEHNQLVAEWAPVRLDWLTVVSGLSLHNFNSTVVLLIAAAVAASVAVFRRQFGAAVWLCGACYLGLRHQRLLIFFALIVVVIAGSILNSAISSLLSRINDVRVSGMLTGAACCLVVLLALVWSVDLVSNRVYMGRTGMSGMASFGAGRGWWFPEGAASFIERERIPGQIFNTYDEGGYVVWRLGPEYKDYVDGRGDPFGTDLILRSTKLVQRGPDSVDWQQESERYGINAIIVPLGRYWGVDRFPLLRQFCAGENWRPVYLDETSAVFVRRTPATENLLSRLQIDCETAPIPVLVPSRTDNEAYNRWANAASVLAALGRVPEALAATSKALAIFADSGSLQFTRASLLEAAGDWRGAEQGYLLSANLEPDPASWTHLAQLYEREQRVQAAIPAWKNAASVSSDEAFLPLLSLGFDYLSANQPREALDAFDRSQMNMQKYRGSEIEPHKPYYATLAHGRAMSWEALGNMSQAIAFEEQTVTLAPERKDDWLELARLYAMQGRAEDAERARERALP